MTRTKARAFCSEFGTRGIRDLRFLSGTGIHGTHSPPFLPCSLDNPALILAGQAISDSRAPRTSAGHPVNVIAASLNFLQGLMANLFQTYLRPLTLTSLRLQRLTARQIPARCKFPIPHTLLQFLRTYPFLPPSSHLLTHPHQFITHFDRSILRAPCWGLTTLPFLLPEFPSVAFFSSCLTVNTFPNPDSLARPCLFAHKYATQLPNSTDAEELHSQL